MPQAHPKASPGGYEHVTPGWVKSVVPLHLWLLLDHGRINYAEENAKSVWETYALKMSDTAPAHHGHEQPFELAGRYPQYYLLAETSLIHVLHPS